MKLADTLQYAGVGLQIAGTLWLLIITRRSHRLLTGRQRVVERVRQRLAAITRRRVRGAQTVTLRPATEIDSAGSVVPIKRFPQMPDALSTEDRVGQLEAWLRHLEGRHNELVVSAHREAERRELERHLGAAAAIERETALRTDLRRLVSDTLPDQARAALLVVLGLVIAGAPNGWANFLRTATPW